MKTKFPYEAVYRIEPVVKGRPRMGKWGAYTPKRTKDFEGALKDLMAKYFFEKPLDGPIFVSIILGLKKPKKPKHLLPLVRGDVDNFSKAVLDAGNGVLWTDDVQICQLAVSKVYAESPYIYLRIELIGHEEAQQLSRLGFGPLLDRT